MIFQNGISHKICFTNIFYGSKKLRLFASLGSGLYKKFARFSYTKAIHEIYTKFICLRWAWEVIMIWAIIVILGFILDRVSKVWAIDALADKPFTVIDNFFYFRYLENRGAAFSILEGKTLFLIIMTSLVSLAVLFVIFKYKDKFLRTTLSLILSGALGNLYDRIAKGSVTDFIDFHFGSYVFPTFNVADMFVVVGTILMAIYILFIYKEDKPAEKQESVEEPIKEEK